MPERPSPEEADAYMLRCNSYSRLPELLDLAPRMERGDWLRLLGNHWSCCDNIGPHRLRLRRLLPREGPIPELMTPEEAAAYADLPDRLTVYRGCGLVNIRGASWSLDRDTAARFPFLNRYRQDQPLLVTATVRKARILALKIDRDESEIITFHARRVEVEELSEAPPAAAPAMPAPSLSGLAEALQALPLAQLRQMAGIRRKCGKAEAVAVICALPI